MNKTQNFIVLIFITLSLIAFLISKGGFWKVSADLTKELEQLSHSLEIDTTLFLLLVLVGVIFVVGLLLYGGIRFAQRGLPSDRTLNKIRKQVGNEPFTLEKTNGKWVATIIDNKTNISSK